MPTVYCSPFGPKPQFELTDGTPAVGYKLFTYVGGSVNTKQPTYTDYTGGSSNTNPIVLNTLGQPSTEIWLAAGVSYKFVLAPSTDTDPPSSPIWTIDGLRGINDASVSVDQWIAGPVATYSLPNQFTLAGDQTSTFHVGRRVKAISLGPLYGTITNSAYVTSTTVTVAWDSGALDPSVTSPSVWYGLLSATEQSIAPRATAMNTARLLGRSTAGVGGAEELTVGGGLSLSSGTLAGSTAWKNLTASVAGNALTATLASGTFLQFSDGTTATLGSSISVTVPSGQAMGTSNGIASRLWVVAMKNGGTPELAIINTWDGTNVYAILPTDNISTTAIAAAPSAQVWYSTTARSSQPIDIVGYIESTQATAGTWLTAPSLVQGYGPNVPLPGAVLQKRRVQSGAVLAVGSTAVPLDDTIPQNTEGDSLNAALTDRTITARSALNIARITAAINFSAAGSVQTALTVFQDAGANAIAVAATQTAAAGSNCNLTLGYETIVGTTSATTYKLRLGNSGGSATTLNGRAGARDYGGTYSSWFQVEEVMR